MNVASFVTGFLFALLAVYTLLTSERGAVGFIATVRRKALEQPEGCPACGRRPAECGCFMCGTPCVGCFPGSGSVEDPGSRAPARAAEGPDAPKAPTPPSDPERP